MSYVSWNPDDFPNTQKPTGNVSWVFKNTNNLDVVVPILRNGVWQSMSDEVFEQILDKIHPELSKYAIEKGLNKLWNYRDNTYHCDYKGFGFVIDKKLENNYNKMSIFEPTDVNTVNIQAYEILGTLTYDVNASGGRGSVHVIQKHDLKKTDETVTLGKLTRVVYKTRTGAKYVKLNGELKRLALLKKRNSFV